MKKLSSILHDILKENKKSPTNMSDFDGKTTLPTPKGEKHDATYHQDEPVPFKKPESSETPEKEQQDVLDRNTETAERSIDECELTEAQKLRVMQERLFASVTEEAPLGSGERFKKLSNKLSHEKGVTDPDALAASIGRKKYGAKKMGKLSHHENTDVGEK